MKTYFATVARGLEAIAAQELEHLGAKEVQTKFTGVRFSGDQELLYRVNLWARTLFRVLMLLQEIPSQDAQQLYRGVQQIDWSQYLQPKQTLAIRCTGGNQQLNHTHFSALQIKNAIVDQQRKQFGDRSSVDTQHPDLSINAHIHQDRCLLSLDSSGASLHRRGYRPAMGTAPLKETLAAALIKMSDWEPNLPLLDPFCGSGTIVIEAALMSLNVAPGLRHKSFALQRWPDFDADLWHRLVTEAKAQTLSHLSTPIYGSDCDPTILQQAHINAQLCNLDQHLQLTCCDLAKLQAPGDRGIILCNPPYGKRVGEVSHLGPLYQLLGDVLKQRFKGWKAYVLSGNKALAKQIGLKTSQRIPVYNGSLPCTLSCYELY